jgi:hypothetical protein
MLRVKRWDAIREFEGIRPSTGWAIRGLMWLLGAGWVRIDRRHSSSWPRCRKTNVGRICGSGA